VHSDAVSLLDKWTRGDASQSETDNVRLDCCRTNIDLRVGSYHSRKSCSAVVHLAQTAAMMFQCIKRSGRDDSGLAEAAAKLLFEPSGPSDERFRAGKARPDRRPESFRETDAHRVKRGGVPCFRDSRLCGCMPESPWLRAADATDSICSKGQIEPPPTLCVFSTHKSFTIAGIVVEKNGCGIPRAAITSSG
jgi:hypothetical protein